MELTHATCEMCECVSIGMLSDVRQFCRCGSSIWRHMPVTKSPVRLTVHVTFRLKPAVPLKTCSVLWIEKLVCRLCTSLKNVICGFPVRMRSCCP